MEIDLEKVPLSEDVRALGREISVNPLTWALNGGEDYQLTGTISPSAFDTIREETSITPVGRVVKKPGSGVYGWSHGRKRLLEAKGYDHFDR